MMTCVITLVYLFFDIHHTKFHLYFDNTIKDQIILIFFFLSKVKEQFSAIDMKKVIRT